MLKYLDLLLLYISDIMSLQSIFISKGIRFRKTASFKPSTNARSSALLLDDASVLPLNLNTYSPLVSLKTPPIYPIPLLDVYEPLILSL